MRSPPDLLLKFGQNFAAGLLMLMGLKGRSSSGSDQGGGRPDGDPPSSDAALDRVLADPAANPDLPLDATVVVVGSVARKSAHI